MTLAHPASLARILAAALSLAGATLATRAEAQVYVRPFYYGGTWSGPLVMPVPEGSRRMPLDELYEEIADQGYRPLGVVARSAETVVIEAMGPGARKVRLTVDAFDGEILSRRPVVNAKAHPNIRPVPEREAAPQPPRKKVVQAPVREPSGSPSPAGTPPAGSNPDARPVAPARDPSQWGKGG